MEPDGRGASRGTGRPDRADEANCDIPLLCRELNRNGRRRVALFDRDNC